MPAGVVTPEAVLLELPTAGVATRTLARLVDLVLQVVVGIALFLLAGAAIATGVSPELMILVVVVASIIVIPVTVEVLWRGRSPGKALFGLRVVDRDGSPSTPRQAVVRGAVAIIDTYLSLGFLALTVPVAFLPPAGLEALVASLDVSRLDDEDFSLVRAFLLRVDRLDPVDRLRLATELAEGIRRRIDQPVSVPVTAEVWLVCVASAYQSRRGNLLADAALGLAPIAAPTRPR